MIEEKLGKAAEKLALGGKAAEKLALGGYAQSVRGLIVIEKTHTVSKKKNSFLFVHYRRIPWVNL